MKTLAALGLALAATAPASAQNPALPAMVYYVGNWNCTGGPPGKPAVPAWISYEMDSTALRSTVVARTQGKLSRAWLSVETKWDGVNRIYVDTSYENGGWDVSYARPWTGLVEDWFDRSSANGHLGRDRFVRIDTRTFVHTRYTTLTGTQVEFRVKCTRTK